MKIQSQATNSQTIIAEDVAIDGNMILSGNVTIYGEVKGSVKTNGCLLYTSPSPRDVHLSRMPSSA